MAGRLLSAAALLAALAATPAHADVKAGVDAWSRGDYSSAVREWEAPAAAGDPDAMFNLAQAYRLGRGVVANKARAEGLYARAAAAGHVQAADTYGLLLFQDGRHEAALPYIKRAAARGDPRAMYLLGIAHFNGDLVEKDWTRAYALTMLASGAGLQQAVPAIAEMDRIIPLDQRQQAAGLAVRLRNEADAARTLALTDAELDTRQPEGPEPVQIAAAQPESRLPRPIPTVAISPSIAAARAAVEEARRATGAESPAEAGASFAWPSSAQAALAAVPPAPAPRPAPVVAAVSPAPPPSSSPTPAAPPGSASGPWRVQLGAFSVAGNAEQLWRRLSGRSELAGTRQVLVPAGRVTKLQAGGFASRALADAACRSLKQSGQDCLVTDR